MIKPIKDVQYKSIKSAYLECPFDEGKRLLEREGYRIPSLIENAKLRIQEGIESYVSQKGNWVREGMLCVEGKEKYLILESPIMDNPYKATQAHRKREEYYLDKEQTEKALVNAIKIPDKIFSIPTNRFGEDDFTRFILKDIAEDYGYFLKQAKINEMPVLAITEPKSQKYNNPCIESFVRLFWFYGLNCESILDAPANGLAYNSTVRGVY